MYAVQDGYNYYASAAILRRRHPLRLLFVINLFVAVIYDAFAAHAAGLGAQGGRGCGGRDARAGGGEPALAPACSISAEEIARVPAGGRARWLLRRQVEL